MVKVAGTSGLTSSALPRLALGDAEEVMPVRIGAAELAFDLHVEQVGASISHGIQAAVEADGWSGMRVWDYSDPENPVLAATFNTVCSAEPEHPICDPRGTYSSHNVVVEDTDDGQIKAYISWYSDGVLVLDVTDPYNPVEVGRYHEAGEAFEARNGGIQDVWGIYKVTGEPWLYASDRNGGLYILKERGAGSARVAQN